LIDFDTPKWEQRVRPNGDIVAILAMADFHALIDRVRKLKRVRRAAQKVTNWETTAYSKDPVYWTATRLDAMTELVAALADLEEK
jgi:hypothetical protein